MNNKHGLISAAIAATLTSGLGPVPSAASGAELLPIEDLGREIFFDKSLSLRKNQACATCHVPEAGWVGADSKINEAGAVYEGSIPGEFGNRNPPSSAYATLSPISATWAGPDRPRLKAQRKESGCTGRGKTPSRLFLRERHRSDTSRQASGLLRAANGAGFMGMGLGLVKLFLISPLAMPGLVAGPAWKGLSPGYIPGAC